jgi:hypothetical protein
VWPHEEPEKSLFAKVSLRSLIAGDRRIQRRHVSGAVGKTIVLKESRSDLPDNMNYLYESVGFMPRLLPGSGVILRSIPQAVKGDKLLLAPMFSLVGGNEEYVPLLLKMVAAGISDPTRFAEEVLCASFAPLWLNLALNYGLLLEAHGQNLLVELSDDFCPLGRFYYRDFDGLMIDWDLRRHLGFPVPQCMPDSALWHQTYATMNPSTPYVQLVSWKFKMSLNAYLHFVLADVNRYLREWQSRGLMAGRKIADDYLTDAFSHHLFREIAAVYGAREASEYNVYRSLNKFVKFLLKIRGEVITTATQRRG